MNHVLITSQGAYLGLVDAGVPHGFTDIDRAIIFGSKEEAIRFRVKNIASHLVGSWVSRSLSDVLQDKYSEGFNDATAEHEENS